MQEREVKALWGQSLYERYQELEKGVAFDPATYASQVNQ